MTQIDRILRDIIHDPWTSRVFLAFTVGLFLSCSAEFAASQAPSPVRVPMPAAESPSAPFPSAAAGLAGERAH